MTTKWTAERIEGARTIGKAGSYGLMSKTIHELCNGLASQRTELEAAREENEKLRQGIGYVAPALKQQIRHTGQSEAVGIYLLTSYARYIVELDDALRSQQTTSGEDVE